MGDDERREDDGLANHLAAGIGGDVDSVAARARRAAEELVLAGGRPAAVADAALVDAVGIAIGGIAREHAEALRSRRQCQKRETWNRISGLRLKTYRLEGSGLAAGDIVHGDAAHLVERALRAAVADLTGAVEAAVLVLEVHGGGPVVGLVLGVGARRAARAARQVVLAHGHGRLERVATDNLVDVRRVGHAGKDEGVGALDHELGAGEAQHVELGGSIVCQAGDCQGSEGEPSHGGVCQLSV